MSASQHKRLQALRSYDILHSAQEKLFDDLTALAAYIFSVPVARIAFVGQDEVWHKASVGMPALESLAHEQTLCSQAVQAEEPVLVYSDLRQLENADIHIVQERQVVFYAGALLCTPQGQCIGTVCLAGHEPREFTRAEQQVLSQLAALVMLALEARRQLLTSAGPAAWQQLREQAEEELHNQMALVRYLKVRSGGQVPVPVELLEPMAKRLEEVAQVLRPKSAGTAE
ncbi:GAF domain-containing protein [Hymenobacter weizhouensis]|uniref:GAF domain-containing protein n=1 Tax=Hymenobacter sp. YIM 151500-1 TaxID=2987689 RepID=UPI002226B97C|nr:GAF domain-containing protein [Hymenobacter sp. YIM 151500-1]UYZ64385.1 GAF domain-containing protein [Hymenobacter sp. YIM 151500-1]